MNKRVYQQPTMNVVKLQHKNHILAGSVQTVSGPLKYGGAGGDHQANSRGGDGEWDDEGGW